MMANSSIDRRLDYLAAGWRPWCLLILLSLALFVPGIAALPPVDRDESRYIQASRQMLETGDFVQIRFQDEARNKKPAGVYWLQSAAVTLFSKPESTEVWPYRLVSVLGATAGVLLTFFFGTAIFDRRTALIAASLLASSTALVIEAHLATTDAVLLPTVVAAQGILGLAYLCIRRGEPLGLGMALGFWLAEAASILVKGPVVPALSILTIITLVVIERRARWLLALRPLIGLPLLALLVLPWVWAIQTATQGAFLRDAMGHDFAGKLGGGQEAHGAWPGYYLALLPVTFWPASLFLGVLAVWIYRARRLPAAKLLAAWVVPFWIVLELVPTKLPHYVLPLYPALAFGTARALIAIGEEGWAQPPRWVRIAVIVLWSVVGLSLSGAMLLVPPILHVRASAGGAVAVAAVLAIAWHVVFRDRLRLHVGSGAIAIIAALLVMTPALQLVLPGLNTIWLSRSAARLVASQRAAGDVVSSTGYSEPSLVFLLGTETKLLPAELAAADLADKSVALSLVADEDDQAFRTALSDKGATVEALGDVSGTDYSNGKRLNLRLYRLVTR